MIAMFIECLLTSRRIAVVACLSPAFSVCWYSSLVVPLLDSHCEGPGTIVLTSHASYCTSLNLITVLTSSFLHSPVNLVTIVTSTAPPSNFTSLISLIWQLGSTLFLLALQCQLLIESCMIETRALS